MQKIAYLHCSHAATSLRRKKSMYYGFLTTLSWAVLIVEHEGGLRDARAVPTI